jgi:hypothetical protein
MITPLRSVIALLMLALALAPCRAVELTITRAALEKTLRQQLFSSPDGRYYLKGDAKSGCSISAEDPHLIFENDRILVKVKAHAKVGGAVGGACLGVPITVPAEVSVLPDAEGETVGFRDARLEKATGHREIDFALAPFLRRKVPSSMKVNAADLLRKALVDSAATTGYKISLTRLNIHSIVIQGDALVVDVDGDFSIE